MREASELLALPSGGLAYWVAAARECFEEAGILLAQDETGAASAAPERSRDSTPIARRSIGANSRSPTCWQRHALLLPAREFDLLRSLDHAARAPAAIRHALLRRPRADGPGTARTTTTRPCTASGCGPPRRSTRAERKEIEIAFATGIVLQELAALRNRRRGACARARQGPHRNESACWSRRAARDRRLFRRADAPYAEIHWSDPEETTQTTYDLDSRRPEAARPLRDAHHRAQSRA